ncbi:TetR/AcrR family transcriptional regulator [Nonomuraea pusilla]|uniref:Transcriptional regulator, TetR family n=1 Tax=Nonomuraea pusilla TaxID=46177 RepID=A0A1H8G8Z5_9ACTN|nr:TetR family transcriptional regulator [Nonomuraea pusilla]SEN40225.1 transcriptional regulator, TetR family [Nonomuraea pusilla]
MSVASGSAEGASRRERQREQLLRDARAAARQITASEGVEGLTLAAVARRVGVSSPALYRYFDGRQGLVHALYEDLTAELIGAVREAARRQDEDDISAQLDAATRAVLEWSLANRAEFGLLMGATYATAAASQTELRHVISRELGGVFGELFLRLLRTKGLEYPPDDRIPPALRRQLATYREILQPELPLGVVQVMIACWRQIYGLVSMAVYGHLAFAFDDIEPLFDDMMDSLLALLGLEPSPNRR